MYLSSPCPLMPTTSCSPIGIYELYYNNMRSQMYVWYLSLHKSDHDPLCYKLYQVSEPVSHCFLTLSLLHHLLIRGNQDGS